MTGLRSSELAEDSGVPSSRLRPAVACSLSDHDLQSRIAEWRQLVAAALHTTRTDGEVRVVFGTTAALIQELARLCAAEIACCPSFTFNLDINSQTVVLAMRSANAEETIARLVEGIVVGPPGGER